MSNSDGSCGYLYGPGDIHACILDLDTHGDSHECECGALQPTYELTGTPFKDLVEERCQTALGWNLHDSLVAYPAEATEILLDVMRERFPHLRDAL